MLLEPLPYVCLHVFAKQNDNICFSYIRYVLLNLIPVTGLLVLYLIRLD